MMASASFSQNTLFLSGNLNAGTIPALFSEAKRLIRHHKPSRLDLSALEAIDSAGVACLEEIIAAMGSPDRMVMVTEPPEEVQSVIRTFRSTDLVAELEPPRPGYFEQLGANLLSRLNSFGTAVFLASEIWYWSLVGIFNHRAKRKGSTTQQCLILGYSALPIVALLSFIIGFILSLQSAVQLKIYGANVFIADLLAVTMVREMGPLITAIIVAGRSGSAIASEVATMQVTEELDALRMMALNPVRYVIVPKFHAITLMMPILVAFSILVSEIGGALIALGYLDLSAATFVNRSIEIITLKDLVVSFTKSTVFAWLIVIIGAHFGFQVKGGAEGVGRATTSSVVAAIFAVIIADALFSLLYL
jgi:phospholipid/cholesterol/gamma-HCH transport system permease protein